MALSIQNNIASLVAQGNLNKASSALNTSLQRLSSGLKINSGADSPAGLVISNEQGAQIAGLQSAIDNTNQAVSLVQTGEGALSTVNDLLVQIRGLALSAANSAVNDPTALAGDQAQIQNALDTINRISQNTQFGTKKLLDGSSAATVNVSSGSSNLASSSPVVVGPATVAGTYNVSVTQQGQAAQLLATNTFTSAHNSAGAAAGTAISGAVTATDNTYTGTYNVVVTQQGAKGGITAAGAGAANAGGGTITIKGGLLATGGVTATIADLDNLTTQASKIQTALTTGVGGAGAGAYTVDASSGTIVITSNFYGDDNATDGALHVTAGTAGVLTSTGFSTASGGVNVGQAANKAVKVQISGTALSSPVNATADSAGLVTVSSGNANGLSFTIKPSGVGTSTSVAAGTTDSFQVNGDSSLTLNGTQILLDAQNSNSIGTLVATLNAQTSTTSIKAAAAGSNLVLTATKFGAHASTFTFSATGASSGVVSNQSFFQNGQALQAQIYDSNGNTLGGVITGSGANGLSISANGTSFGGANGLIFNFAALGSANGVTGTSTAGLPSGGYTASATITDALVFQIGANQNQTASLSIQNTSASQLGRNATGTVTNPSTTDLSKIDVTTSSGAQDALAIIDKAINDISGLRGKLGAFQTNTLQATASNLQTTLTNTTAAQSVIRDTDFAAETANFTKAQVLVQAGTTVLTNANATAQLILNLLK